jgi:TPR repeat protein
MGQGISQEDVQAHRWFNLAASRATGEAREDAVENRYRVGGLMNATQVGEARRLAREWDAAHPREP